MEFEDRLDGLDPIPDQNAVTLEPENALDIEEVDSLEEISEPNSIEPKFYEYTHKGGAVERATGPKRVFEICPFLGAIAAKNPAAADAFLKVLEIGQAKMAEKVEAPQPELTKESSVIKASVINETLKDNARSAQTETVSQAQLDTADYINSLHIQEREAADQKNKPSKSQEPNSETVVKEQRLIAPKVLAVAELPEILRRPMAKVKSFKRVELTKTNKQASLNIEQVATTIPKKVFKANEKSSQVVKNNLPKPKLVEDIKKQLPKIHKGEVKAKPPQKEPTAAVTQKEPLKTSEANTIIVDGTKIMASLIASAVIRSRNKKVEVTSQTKLLEADVPATSKPSMPYVEKTELPELPADSVKESFNSYEEFTEIIQAIITPVSAGVELFAEKAEAPQPASVSEIQELPSIALAVSERLADLAPEEIEEISPILLNIIETVQLIDSMRAEEAEVETIDSLQNELEKLVVELIEYLNIDCNAEEIEQFINSLVSASLQLSEKNTIKVDGITTKDEGMHEAKTSFALVTSKLASAEDKVLRILGELALIYSRQLNTSPL